MVYYLDAKLLNGTNHELGFFSLLMALASMVIVWLLLPRSWNPLIRGLILVAASAAMFCPSGAWNFVRGMSGTAWLTANVFALLGILLANRGRTVLAVLVAALALLTYGTGFGVPVALIVVALLRRDRRWRWLLPLGLLSARWRSTSRPRRAAPRVATGTIPVCCCRPSSPTSPPCGIRPAVRSACSSPPPA